MRSTASMSRAGATPSPTSAGWQGGHRSAWSAFAATKPSSNNRPGEPPQPTAGELLGSELQSSFVHCSQLRLHDTGQTRTRRTGQRGGFRISTSVGGSPPVKGGDFVVIDDRALG